MERLIYFAAGNPEKKDRLSVLAAGLNLQLMEVSPLLTGQTIGFLSGIDGFEVRPLKPLETPPVLREEALIFSGHTRERLDEVLRALREGGIYISLKAIVTPHNVNWTLAQLCRELEEERSQMQRMQEEKK